MNDENYGFDTTDFYDVESLSELLEQESMRYSRRLSEARKKAERLFVIRSIPYTIPVIAAAKTSIRTLLDRVRSRENRCPAYRPLSLAGKTY